MRSASSACSRRNSCSAISSCSQARRPSTSSSPLSLPIRGLCSTGSSPKTCRGAIRSTLTVAARRSARWPYAVRADCPIRSCGRATPCGSGLCRRFSLGALTARRMLAGRPLVVPGDGNNLWTITYCEDFAPPFVRLLGNGAALNDHFHLTSDNAYSWNEIHRATAKALGAPPLEMVHVPSETLIRYHPPWEEWLFGDNGYS